QRLFLQLCCSPFVHSGHNPASLSNTACGVFAGARSSDYLADNTSDTMVSSYLGNMVQFVPSRVAYSLNLKGPTIALDTGCSSSLVAIHQACGSLLRNETNMTLAGGVMLHSTPSYYAWASSAHLLSPDGECYTMDDRANGFVPGEAVGVIVMKRLQDAIADGDPIIAQIKASGMNQDGRSNGIAAPDPTAQKNLILDTYKKFAINPEQIQYVEIHGTGTLLGDPIEMQALSAAFDASTNTKTRKTTKKQYCAIGSVKTNLGHTGVASGISGIIKILMSMQHQQLPASLNFESANRHIDLVNSPFYVNTALQQWSPPQGELRTAAISSFSISGTNVHMVLEEYQASPLPRSADKNNQSQPYLFPVSAKNDEQLQLYCKSLLRFLQTEKAELADIAFTLQVARKTLPAKVIFAAQTMAILIEKLRAFGKNRLLTKDAHDPIAKLWLQGKEVNWHTLYGNTKPKRIHLPTVVFAKEKYWKSSESKAQEKVTTVTRNDQVRDKLMEIVGSVLQLPNGIIDPNHSFEALGLDSIVSIYLATEINRNLNIKFDHTQLSQYDTIELLTAEITLNYTPKAAQDSEQTEYPELVHLNTQHQGEPIFWLHTGFGGVEVYQKIAQQIKRPFYGIQARGWMNIRPPIHSIPAMCAYYGEIIQSVQPSGNIELGGFSLGGALAYEVTRQLQLSGRKVSSIVMLDAFDDAHLATALDNANIDDSVSAEKRAMFRAVNTALQPQKNSSLIHANEVNLALDNEQFFNQLITLAKQRGLTQSKIQIETLIWQIAKIQNGYDIKNFAVTALTKPDDVDCYYFRNGSGVYLGELAPYFQLAAPYEKIAAPALDHICYWDKWAKHLPKFHQTVLDSKNHLFFLDERIHQKIINFCDNLYNR
ncbi:MAG: hypothetical protein HRT35_12185, partial [Algicola sp.]|nr:hypothetical protein [Algicola sp.]